MRRPKCCSGVTFPGRIALEFPVTHLADADVSMLAAKRQLERAKVFDVAHRRGRHGDRQVARMREGMRKPRIQRADTGFSIVHLGKIRRIHYYEAARPSLIEFQRNSLVEGGGHACTVDAG